MTVEPFDCGRRRVGFFVPNWRKGSEPGVLQAHQEPVMPAVFNNRKPLQAPPGLKIKAALNPSNAGGKPPAAPVTLLWPAPTRVPMLRPPPLAPRRKRRECCRWWQRHRLESRRRRRGRPGIGNCRPRWTGVPHDPVTRPGEECSWCGSTAAYPRGFQRSGPRLSPAIPTGCSLAGGAGPSAAARERQAVRVSCGTSDARP